MIIDLNTHIWTSVDQLGCETADRLRGRPSDRTRPLHADPGQHETAMACVDATVVMGFRSERMKAHIPAELIADYVRKQPRSRIGVCGVDPMCADAVEQIELAIDLGLSGITVSPASQGFHPAHSSAMRVYERCHALSLPLFVDFFMPLTPGASMEFGRPTHWDEVAAAFPNLPIVIGRLGYPWIDETLVLIGKHANVWTDIAGVASRPWQLYNTLLSAMSLGVMDKLLFASGFPHDQPARIIELLYSVNSFSHGTQLPSIPRTLIRGIVERDSLRCLGIEAEISQRRPTEVVDADVDEPSHPEIEAFGPRSVALAFRRHPSQ